MQPCSFFLRVLLVATRQEQQQKCKRYIHTHKHCQTGAVELHCMILRKTRKPQKVQILSPFKGFRNLFYNLNTSQVQILDSSVFHLLGNLERSYSKSELLFVTFTWWFLLNWICL